MLVMYGGAQRALNNGLQRVTFGKIFHFMVSPIGRVLWRAVFHTGESNKAGKRPSKELVPGGQGEGERGFCSACLCEEDSPVASEQEVPGLVGGGGQGLGTWEDARQR